MRVTFIGMSFLLLLLMTEAHAASRIKDITSVQGVRDNQLVGYGLVIGLNGSGDSLRGSPFTEQSLRSMLDRMGINVTAGSIRSRNVAAVVVTATLPPFAGKGTRVDVTASSLGDATSLQGGTLVLTPLMAADGNAYAVAQGPIMITGFTASGDAESLTQGVPTSGRLPNGALIERELAGEFNTLPHIVLKIGNADFATAVDIADSINAFSRRRFGRPIAAERDPRTVVVTRPEGITASRLMAEVGAIEVDADSPARIVVDERTGTIVIGDRVRISPVAVTHGSLTVRVTETPTVSQPEPFSEGVTAIEPSTSIDASEEGGQVAILDGTDLQALVDGLNRMGLKPNGIIAILQAIKSAGAIQAELVVQ